MHTITSIFKQTLEIISYALPKMKQIGFDVCANSKHIYSIYTRTNVIHNDKEFNISCMNEPEWSGNQNMRFVMAILGGNKLVLRKKNIIQNKSFFLHFFWFISSRVQHIHK